MTPLLNNGALEPILVDVRMIEDNDLEIVSDLSTGRVHQLEQRVDCATVIIFQRIKTAFLIPFRGVMRLGRLVEYQKRRRGPSPFPKPPVQSQMG